MIERVHGNLLDAQVEALVNTVNTVGVMGKGIALQFKKAFPANYKAYKLECDAGRLEPGKIFVFDAGGITMPRYIFNFPTKRHWRQPSKIEYIRSGLAALVGLVRRLKIRSIALPPLGCGSGGLAWSEVYPLIEQAFRELPDVAALVYEPAGAPAPESIKNRTERPEMTVGRAAVLVLMHRYLATGYEYLLSLIEVQKLAYFLQVAGQPLQLLYKPSYYGPYADNLRHVLNRLEGHYILGYGDAQNKPETPLRLQPDAADEAEAFLQEDREAQARLERVTALIEGFETPYGMELLATVHWVASHDQHARQDPEVAIRGVQAWSQRKFALMKPEHIRAAWQRLKEQSWM